MLKLSLTEPLSTTALHQASKHIRYRNIDNRVVILDLRNGEYIIFDEVATYIWEVLLTVSDRTQCIHQIANHFKIHHSQCEQDMDAFIESCKKRGFFYTDGEETENLSAINLKYNKPSTVNAWKCLYVTRRSLARLGFSKTYNLHSRLMKPETSAGFNAEKSLSTAVQSFQRAENFFSTKDVGIDCLPRSLALHRFLISVGLDANHCIGVRCFPFGAHAWVEFQGEPVCDTESFINKYNEISRV